MGVKIGHPSALDLPSSESQQLLAEVRRLARHDFVNVCFVGPSGTGKTLYAREIHTCSPRAKGPLKKVNLSAIASGIAGSDILGHLKGSFTGASEYRAGALLTANGGTLILDEVTKASARVQHIMLELFDREPIRQFGSDVDVFFDVRLVALSSVALEVAVSEGKLIPDLFERLKPFVLEIKPLAKRLADLPAVIATALRQLAPQFGYQVAPQVDDSIIAYLRELPLTGNHRELDGIVQRLLVNAQGAPILHRGHLPRSAAIEAPSTRTNHQRYLDDQRREIKLVFGTVKEEARHYGVSPATIHRWRKDLCERSVANRNAGASRMVASPSSHLKSS